MLLAGPATAIDDYARESRNVGGGDWLFTDARFNSFIFIRTVCGHHIGLRKVDERRLLCGASAKCMRDGSGQLYGLASMESSTLIVALDD